MCLDITAGGLRLFEIVYHPRLNAANLDLF
ncbi:hypothetical protein VPHF86_0203 [Vibrio phage F86]